MGLHSSRSGNDHFSSSLLAVDASLATPSEVMAPINATASTASSASFSGYDRVSTGSLDVDARRHRRCVAPLPGGVALSTSSEVLCNDNVFARVLDVGLGPQPVQVPGFTWDPERLLSGDVVRSCCTMKELLPLYQRVADPVHPDDPYLDLDALHARHVQPFLRRSPRLAGLPPTTPIHPTRPLAARKQQPEKLLDLNQRTACKRKRGSDNKWQEDDGSLRVPDGGWSEACLQPMDLSSPIPVLSLPHCNVRSEGPPLKKKSQPGKGCKTKRGKRSMANKAGKALARGETLSASAFSLLTDATVSTTGWQGGRPPLETRETVLALWKQGPLALRPILSKFYPAPYIKYDDVRKERACFFVDREGTIFLFRSYRAMWLMERVAEVETACRILVGSDLGSKTVRAKYSSHARGSHMPIIIGHHRQSMKTPILTEWHRKHEDRVTEFMKQPIIIRIIKWISWLVELVFPGVARRFRRDAQWHEDQYGIRPLFGLFYNFCLNAWFPDQRRIHCAPHTDWRNQIGVCALLIYVLESGRNFNDDLKTWLVIWEAGVAVHLPPWVAALYPSSLFYHFNVDVDQIEFVTTAGDVLWPTKKNSRPLVDGDDCGRGSMVFFNQATMVHGPATGFDTLDLAPPELRTIDPNISIQEAFSKHVVFKPMASFL